MKRNVIGLLFGIGVVLMGLFVLSSGGVGVAEASHSDHFGSESDNARWVARGESYASHSDPFGSASDNARWVARGESYAAVSSSGFGSDSDNTRWIALGEAYQELA